MTKKTTFTTHTAEHKLAVSKEKIGKMQKKLAQKYEKERSLAKQNKKKHNLVEEVQKKQDLQELQQTMVVTATGSLLELKGDDDDDDDGGDDDHEGDGDDEGDGDGDVSTAFMCSGPELCNAGKEIKWAHCNTQPSMTNFWAPAMCCVFLLGMADCVLLARQARRGPPSRGPVIMSDKHDKFGNRLPDPDRYLQCI